MDRNPPLFTGVSYRPPARGWREVVAVLVLLAIVVLLGTGMRQMTGPVALGHPQAISLSPVALPAYTLRTVVRMLAALAASLVFTFVYATLAAKNRRAEIVLIPLLDVLQSVPVLGYLSFTVSFFIALAPGSQLGPELAAIFAIFTSQAWNMTFGFYQSLRTTPQDLVEAGRSVRCSAWQRFWQLEVPFAIPGLVWNMMMSMAGGWFFVVASEDIAVGTFQLSLPGVGSYVARAIQERSLVAVAWAIAAMTLAILICDQVIFRPLVAWADRFRVEETTAQDPPRSWVLELYRNSPALRSLAGLCGAGLHRAACARFAVPTIALPRILFKRCRRVLVFGCSVLILAGGAYLLLELVRAAQASLSLRDLSTVAAAGALTLARMLILILLASAVWVPVGIIIGLRPKLTAAVQPVAEFLAAFPANLLFPLAVYAIVKFGLEPRIWLSLLMILGTQWYILFNVIAGASAYPSDLREAATSLRVRNGKWWRQVILPGVFPYYVTGAITASGGSWNASIVSEVVSWGATTLSASGLGAYIAQMTQRGDYVRIGLGIAMMSVLVIITNRLLWRPLYVYAERRTRLA